jgi:queuosine precursor transporter
LNNRALWATAAITVYSGGVFASNWLIENVGTVTLSNGTHLLPVGFGLMAPSGVYAAGFVLVARDVVQLVAGRLISALVILPGAALSAFLNPRLAVASACAFAVSEALDWAVFSSLVRRSLPLAVLISGAVGSVADSLIFLKVAQIPLAVALAGVLLGKLWIQVLALPVIRASRQLVARRT